MAKQRSFDDPRYRIPLHGGSYAINFSKWSRENEPKPPHKYVVGDNVLLITETEITHLTFDCDGTALYSLLNHGNGYSENSITKIPDLSEVSDE